MSTLLLERDDLTIVLKDVSAEVCGSCGEEYFAEAAAAFILGKAEQAACNHEKAQIRDHMET